MTLDVLANFQKLPLSEAEIIRHVASGEDIRLLDLAIVKQNCREMREAFPYASIYAAVKANTSNGVLEMLNREGAHFEIATIEELEICLERGIAPEKILFSHPAKDALEISEAYKMGVTYFVSDSSEDISLIAQHAPLSRVLVRIVAANEEHTRDDITGFNTRFGVKAGQAVELLKKTAELGLVPYGICFHVGTQQEDVNAWDKTIENAAHIYRQMAQEGIKLEVLDLGGGFPSRYKQEIPPLASYGTTISHALKTYFKDIPLKEIIIEPGRALSAMAGVTIGRVMNVKPCNDSNRLIVTLSTGRFSAGLFGVGNQMFFYRKRNGAMCNFEGEATKKANIYGKACASFDMPIEGEDVTVPASLASGDIVAFSGTGAYSGQMVTKWCSRKAPVTYIFDSSEMDEPAEILAI